MVRRWLWSAALALVVGQALPVDAATVDRTLNIQGMVLTSSGVPAGGTFTMTFRLFAAQTGGTKLWEQVKTGVVVTAGVFDVQLGPMITGVLEAYDAVWVETEVEGTVLPRVPLRAVAYSLVAQLANDVSCSGCIANSDIADAGIGPSKLASGTYGINISGNAATATSATTALNATNFTGALAGDVTGTQGATQVAKVRGVTVSATAPTSGQVLRYSGSQWEPATPAAGSVTSVNSGAGLTGGPITSSGTLSIANNGITPAMVSSGSYGISISGNAATATTAAGFSGALAGDVVGTQGATSVTKVRGVTVSATTPASGQVLKYDGTQWAPAADNAGAGTVTSVATGKGLQGGTITSSGTLSVRVSGTGGLSDSLGGGSNELGIAAGGITPAMVGSGTYGINISGSAASAASATSATNFTGSLAGDVTGTQGATTVGKLQGRVVSATAPSSGQVLKYNATTSQWEPGADATGSGVTSVTASAPLASSGGTAPNITLGTVPTTKGGTGLTAGPTAAGQFLRATGNDTWGIAGLQAGDVPSGSGSYIWNTTSAQSANFNVTGSGTVGGILVANGSMRSPIFYDLNNTSYYLDPASGSQVSTIYANAWFRAQGQSGFYFEDYGGGIYMTDSTWVRVYNGKALLASNEIRSESNVRAPIFYDLNDGGYYVDPNGTSRLNAVYPNTITCMNGYCPANYVARLTPNLHLNALAGYSVILNWDNGTTGSAQTLRIGNGAGSDVFYVRADGLVYAPQYRDLNDGSYYLDPASVSILNDVRATIFYDLNDTGYYVNPNSVTQLHYVLANNWFRAQGTTGFYFESYGGGWHMTDGTWIRAYNSKPVYVAAEIQSGTLLRGPIMYDLNDGGFYMDPNGTSRLQHTRQDGRVWHDGGCPAPFDHAGGYHSYAGYTNKICMWRSGWNTFPEMQNVCFAMGGHVCSYSDIYAMARVYGTSPAGIGITNGWWVGNFYADDAVFCVNNQNDRNNFEGGCNKNDGRYAACCYTSTHNE
ncbi:MAG: hypothetical protein AMXMBFR23_28610 [Chloroflexota bacterium]